MKQRAFHGTGISCIAILDNSLEYGCGKSLIRYRHSAKPLGARRLRRRQSVGEAWLGRRPDTAKVAGSNPAEPTLTQWPSSPLMTGWCLGTWVALVFQTFYVRVVRT